MEENKSQTPFVNVNPAQTELTKEEQGPKKKGNNEVEHSEKNILLLNWNPTYKPSVESMYFDTKRDKQGKVKKVESNSDGEVIGLTGEVGKDLVEYS